MKLICIGDSLTFGYGVRPSQRWTRLCAQETGWEIVNEGISGDTTGGMLVRLRALLANRDIGAQRPLVLLMGVPMIFSSRERIPAHGPIWERC